MSDNEAEHEPVECPDCNGAGMVECNQCGTEEMEECDECEGSGELTTV